MILDLDTGTWRLGASVPDSDWNTSAVKYKDTILLIGTKVHEYSIEEDKWIERPERPHQRHGRFAIDVTDRNI